MFSPPQSCVRPFVPAAQAALPSNNWFGGRRLALVVKSTDSKGKPQFVRPLTHPAKELIILQRSMFYFFVLLGALLCFVPRTARVQPHSRGRYRTHRSQPLGPSGCCRCGKKVESSDFRKTGNATGGGAGCRSFLCDLLGLLALLSRTGPGGLGRAPHLFLVSPCHSARRRVLRPTLSRVPPWNDATPPRPARRPPGFSYATRDGGKDSASFYGEAPKGGGSMFRGVAGALKDTVGAVKGTVKDTLGEVEGLFKVMRCPNHEPWSSSFFLLCFCRTRTCFVRFRRFPCAVEAPISREGWCKPRCLSANPRFS